MTWDRLRERLKAVPVGAGVSEEFSFLSLGDTRALLDERDRLAATLLRIEVVLDQHIDDNRNRFRYAYALAEDVRRMLRPPSPADPEATPWEPTTT